MKNSTAKQSEKNHQTLLSIYSTLRRQRFEMMSANYEEEQKRLKIAVSELITFNF